MSNVKEVKARGADVIGISTASHRDHWFQPLTGVTAEKHDSFISAKYLLDSFALSTDCPSIAKTRDI